MDPARRATEAMRAAVASASREARFRRLYADLRETCAAALDAKVDLPLLLAQRRHIQGLGISGLGGDPVAEAMDAILALLPPDLAGVASPEPSPTPEAGFLLSGLDRFLEGGLAKARLLDLRAGGGDLVAAALPRARSVVAMESRLLPYVRAAARLPGFDGLAFAHPLALPPHDPTPTLDLFADEGAVRLKRARESSVDAIVADLRGVRDLPKWVRWAKERLGREGVFAFVSDVPLVDDPALAEFRAELRREFDRIAHVAGATFLVRRKNRLRAARALRR